MNVDQISQRLLELQRQINSLASKLPEGHQINFEIADFSRPEDVVPCRRLLITVKKVDHEVTDIVINKAKRVL